MCDIWKAFALNCRKWYFYFKNLFFSFKRNGKFYRSKLKTFNFTDFFQQLINLEVSVLIITGNRTVILCKMNSDLMHAAGFQLKPY